jgi:signal transduction histidine kinase
LKQAKVDLERSSQELEARVERRTEELSRANKALIGEIVQRTEAEKAIIEISSREQRRLSEDLHDGLCQVLAATKLLSEDVKEKLAVRAAPETDEMALIESRLGEALTQADNISRGLYPVDLETHGLTEALQELADKISKIYPVECRFTCWNPVSVYSSSVGTHLYRIAQEAVINAIKSGKAKRIMLRLQAQGRQGVLSILDNGIGFRASEARKGMGIKMMNFRAHMILASLRFRSGAKGGTVVRCRFPMQNHFSELENAAHAND